MQLAELIVADARERGLEHFFGIPSGAASLDVVNAGGRLGVEFVSVAHESTAAIAAGYYGLARDTAGLALAIKGVGAGNLAGGAVTAHFERLPVVCLCESPPSQATRKSLVQYCDHTGLYGAVAKSSVSLEPSQAPAMVREAAFGAADGRRGSSATAEAVLAQRLQEAGSGRGEPAVLGHIFEFRTEIGDHAPGFFGLGTL